MSKTRATGCVCGHLARNPIWVGHVDAPGGKSLPVCRSCVDDPYVRQAFVEAFKPHIEARRETYRGMSARERKKIADRTRTRGEQQKRKEVRQYGSSTRLFS